MAIKVYTKQFAQTLPKVFEVRQHFLRTFGGKLQVVDGVTYKDTFMTLKVSDTDVTVQEYSTDENVGFGEGTGKTSRFGERKEITSIDKDIPYEKPLAIHEGVDSVTVNDNVDQVIQERAGLHAEAWVEKLNGLLGKALSENASETLTGTDVAKVFNEARKKFVNNKVTKNIGWVAYVKPEIYAAIIDHNLTTTGKKSGADVDNHEIVKFKGFIVEELADEYFEDSENVIFAADNVGVVGVGLEVYRVLDSEDFNGVAIQAAAKYGKYIPEKNKKAILKANITAAPGA